MADPAVLVSGLRKTYRGRKRETRAVDGVDLDVRAGEIFALLGPNGAGKSTTVEILEGYRDRDAGEVAVLGTDPQTAGEGWRARIGIVLQNTKDLGELTVRESLATFAAYYPRARPVDEVLGLVGLTDKAKALGSSLSGGLRRRLDVGLGIIGRPELLFLDEPTTGFDPEARRQFWALISAQNLDEAEALADRVAVINAGRIVEVNTPDRLGGRGEAQARVTWRDPGGHLEQVATDTPTAVVTDLAARYGGEVPELTVTRPSLEDVYLTMIGHGTDGTDGTAEQAQEQEVAR